MAPPAPRRRGERRLSHPAEASNRNKRLDQVRLARPPGPAPAASPAGQAMIPAGQSNVRAPSAGGEFLVSLSLRRPAKRAAAVDPAAPPSPPRPALARAHGAPP